MAKNMSFTDASNVLMASVTMAKMAGQESDVTRAIEVVLDSYYELAQDALRMNQELKRLTKELGET